MHWSTKVYIPKVKAITFCGICGRKLSRWFPAWFHAIIQTIAPCDIHLRADHENR